MSYLIYLLLSPDRTVHALDRSQPQQPPQVSLLPPPRPPPASQFASKPQAPAFALLPPPPPPHPGLAGARAVPRSCPRQPQPLRESRSRVPSSSRLREQRNPPTASPLPVHSAPGSHPAPLPPILKSIPPASPAPCPCTASGAQARCHHSPCPSRPLAPLRVRGSTPTVRSHTPDSGQALRAAVLLGEFRPPPSLLRRPSRAPPRATRTRASAHHT